jgi:Tfp pilus assembly protein PilF
MLRQIALPAALVASLATASCSSCRAGTPAPAATLSDGAYREAVTAFATALAALETSQEVLARQKLDRFVALAPQEPAGLANIGLLLLRQQEVDQAHERLAKAESLAPTSAHIQRLLAITESRRGRLDEAIRHWRRALELDPADVKAAYALAQELERQGGPDADAQASQTLERLLARGDNLPARLDALRLAAKRSDAAALQRALDPLIAASASWPAAAQAQLKLLRESAAANPRAAATRAVFLKNVLVREPAYRRALAAISTPLDAVGEPLRRFLVLDNPPSQPAAADTALAFTVARPADDRAEQVTWTGVFAPGAADPPIVARASAADVWVSRMLVTRRDRPAPDSLPGFDAIAAADLDYDFLTDLVEALPSGLRIRRQTASLRFEDVTAVATLPAPLLTRGFSGVWAADIDTDGDIDLVAAPTAGALLALRNNGDRTFAVREPFPGCTDVRGFVWADLDGDGVPDASVLDARGDVHALLSLRGGDFLRQTLPPAPEPTAAIAPVDSGGEAGFALAALSPQGAIRRLTFTDGAWTWRDLARLSTAPANLAPGAARLLVADVDNNGAADLIASGPQTTGVVLAGPGGSFAPLAAPIEASVRDAADLDGDGRLELLGIDANRHAVVAQSRGATRYGWQTIRGRAATATGDQRINSFGIGGEVEVRAGLNLQRRVITSPIVHVGLGNLQSSDVIRIVWPNGVLQSEFEKPANTTVAADQRLKGSCPWLFAWNGREMAFVTDVIWRSPLGLRINAQATTDVLMTEDRVRVRGDQLVARDDAYDLRITAELWETHFFDAAALFAVDHPAGTEVFLDERFAIPAPSLAPRITGPVEAMASARDDGGRDVAEVVRARDDRHLDFAGRGAYQGITRDHFVELTLPETAPRSGPLWLVAQGWVHPTDSSINVAISQGRHAPPRGLSLHVADAQGRFREVRANLGFPAGKDKTVLIALEGVFPAAGPRRLRLATNLEIYWDRLGWAAGRSDVHVEPRRLALRSAELRYRGYSETTQRVPSSPLRPRYVLAGTAARWLDLEGYYTRFGDVRALLGGVDDRYVIMNAGDELALRFAAAAPPAPGLVRDFIMMGDGWVKDGDYNTSFSRTVLPLPTHASGKYDTAPRQLEDDPVYRAHADDFSTWHTRYVSPAPARRALSDSDAGTGLNPVPARQQ